MYNINESKESEAEEENMLNKMGRKLTELSKEKDALTRKLNEEDNYVHQILKRKLDQLNKEKSEMELKLEQENEYIVNRLSKQLHEALFKKEYTHKLVLLIECWIRK